MKCLVLVLLLVSCVVFPQLGVAQSLKSDHVEVGVFADYFRVDRTDPALNYGGVGGRIGFNVHPNVQIEGEMAYDFERAFNNPFDDGSIVRSKTHILQGLFGPRFQAGTGAFRAFVTGKVGVIAFQTNNLNPTAGFRSTLGAVGNGNDKFLVYPGGGVEGFFGPIGLRLEVGDDIYFDNGARNNLRVTFGPTLRF